MEDKIMAKKQDAFYFDTFIACSDYACRAAELLEKIMKSFDINSVAKQLDDIHAIEHEADQKKHEMVNVLAKAFVTPIEREDIIMLGQTIDEITDKLEDVLIRIYYNRLRTIPDEAIEMAGVICRCCGVVRSMMQEFPNFKRSKKIHEYIITINSIEEEADSLYISSMYKLHDTSTDALEIIALREVYTYLEKCADACEHVADIVESVIMKNS